MNRLRFVSVVCGGVFIGCVGVASFAKPPAAPTKPAVAQGAKEALPSGDSIMKKYVDAIGGAAWAKINTMTGSGTVSVASQGVEGTFTMAAKAPAKIVLKQSIGSLGESTMATDGTTAWSTDPFTGTRTLAGPELTQITTQAVMGLRPDQWKTVYTKAETLGVEKVNSAPAYKVRLTTKSGETSLQYFDVKSGLQVRTDETVISPQGKLPVTSYYADYRVQQGVKMPYSVKQVMGPAEVQTLIKDVKFNVPVDDTQFAQPK